jgi:hypothetical protein
MPRPQTATSDSSPPGEDRAVATTDQPAEIGPFVVTKGQMLTGPQFYARQEERRGTRLLLDDALSWALWVNRDRLVPMAGALFDAYRALVVKALDNDPLGILPASPEVEEACRWLNEIGRRRALKPRP